MSRLIDLTGQKFGRLLVLSKDDSKNPKERKYRTLWNCRCDCGNETVVDGWNLRYGHTLSCGCYKADLTSLRKTTHGMTDTRLFEIWKSMRKRCSNPNALSYPNYGGRGITVCDAWQHGFEPLRDWALSNGYNDSLTIDRIDNDKGYSPDNCRWTTWNVQPNNRRKNRYIDVFGERMTVGQAAKKYRVKPATIRYRICAGWTPEQAVSILPGQSAKLDLIVGGES